MNLLQWERAVAVATMTARERLAPGGGSALMRASGRHPGGRVAGGEGLLAGLIHDVPLVLARHFVGNLRSLLLAVAVLIALASRSALCHARQIGRASCWGRVGQHVSISVGSGSF